MNLLSVSDLGRRVVVRVRLDPAERGPGGEPMTDVLGVLEDLAPDRLAVRRADGRLVDVAGTAILAAKVVPPRRVVRRGVRAVESVAARGWPGLEQAWLGEEGGWLLRAGAGFTGRANSCLPLGAPGRPLAEAVAAVTDWYAARGLPPRFQLPSLLGAGLDAWLAERGWPAAGHAVMMTGGVDGLLGAPVPPAATEPAVRVEVTDQVDDVWLGLYHYRGSARLPAAAGSVLSSVQGAVGFARVTAAGERGAPGEVVAIGRGAVSADDAGTRWLGIAAVEVAATARRQGLGRVVAAALARWGVARGARRAYLQVVVDNVPALRLYEGLGLAEHHRYHYRQPPDRGVASTQVDVAGTVN